MEDYILGLPSDIQSQSGNNQTSSHQLFCSDRNSEQKNFMSESHEYVKTSTSEENLFESKPEDKPNYENICWPSLWKNGPRLSAFQPYKPSRESFPSTSTSGALLEEKKDKKPITGPQLLKTCVGITHSKFLESPQTTTSTLGCLGSTTLNALEAHTSKLSESPLTRTPTILKSRPTSTPKLSECRPTSTPRLLESRPTSTTFATNVQRGNVQKEIVAETNFSWFTLAGRGDFLAEQLQEMIEQGEDIDRVDEDGLSALMWAAYYGQIHTVQILLDTEVVDVDRAGANGETALMLAATEGHLEVVRLLINAGADINIEDYTQNTALMCAVHRDHPHTVNELLVNDADIFVENSDKLTAYDIAVEKKSLKSKAVMEKFMFSLLNGC